MGAGPAPEPGGSDAGRSGAGWPGAAGLPALGRRSGGSNRGRLVGGVIVVALVAIVAVGFGGGLGGGGPIAPAASSAAVGADGSPSPAGSSVAGSGPTADPSSATASGAGAPSPSGGTDTGAPPTGPIADIAVVPVINFRSARTVARPADIAALETGRSPFKALVARGHRRRRRSSPRSTCTGPSSATGSSP